MLKVSNLTKYFGEELILNKVSFNVEKGNKIALVGFNGTGKTTLLKLLAGLDTEKIGAIQYHPKATVAFLPQDPNAYDAQNVLSYLENYVINGEPISDEERDILHRNIEIMFAGFALPSETKDKKIGQLSSGQKTKVFLTAILLKKADLLLLDEPTNNLDLPALIWLEDFLNKTDSAFIVVSHDKKFLDNVSNKVFEIDWNTHELKITAGKYSDYLVQKSKEFARQDKSHELQKDEFKRLAATAAAKKEKARKGMKWKGSDNDKILRGFKRNQAADSLRDAQVLYNRMDRMEVIDKPIARKDFLIDINHGDASPARDITFLDVVCGYADAAGEFKIGPLNFSIPFGSRVCILGLNGSGKTTLLKTITGGIAPMSGELTVQDGVKFGNLMQEHETLPRDKSAVQFLMGHTHLETKQIGEHLYRFGFNEFQINKKIKFLSPGGRARLILAYFSLMHINTLVLDEPTNHLDLEAGEALEKSLKEFAGSVITVTHDRFFVERARMDVLYLLQDGKLNRIENFAAYVAEMEKRSRKLLRLLK